MSRKTDSEGYRKQYHKDTFDKISAEKRENILISAAKEFSTKGFDKARVSDIAKTAGVSHGSIYSYFETKDDILCYLIQQITELQNIGLETEEEFDEDFEKVFRTILNRSFQIAEEQPQLMSTWLSLSFEYNARFSVQVKEIEKTGIIFWQNLLKKAAERKEISPDIDFNASAYIIDSVVANILRGYISEHEKMKLKFHFGNDFEKEKVIDRIFKVIMTFLK